MDSNIKSLKKEREEVLDKAIEKIKKWDSSYEMGIDIIEDFEVAIEELNSFNNLLESHLGAVPFNDDYNKRILILLGEYEDLLKKLDIERKRLLKLIQEIKLKEKIKSNYISRGKESIFIDKDL